MFTFNPLHSRSGYRPIPEGEPLVESESEVRRNFEIAPIRERSYQGAFLDSYPQSTVSSQSLFLEKNQPLLLQADKLNRDYQIIVDQSTYSVTKQNLLLGPSLSEKLDPTLDAYKTYALKIDHDLDQEKELAAKEPYYCLSAASISLVKTSHDVFLNYLLRVHGETHRLDLLSINSKQPSSGVAEEVLASPETEPLLTKSTSFSPITEKVRDLRERFQKEFKKYSEKVIKDITFLDELGPQHSEITVLLKATKKEIEENQKIFQKVNEANSDLLRLSSRDSQEVIGKAKEKSVEGCHAYIKSLYDKTKVFEPSKEPHASSLQQHNIENFILAKARLWEAQQSFRGFHAAYSLTDHLSVAYP